MKLPVLPFVLLLLTGCSSKTSAPIFTPSTDNTASHVTIEDAELLWMQDVEEGTLVRIHDPWHPDQWANQYLLVDAKESWSEVQQASAHEHYGDYELLRTPLQRMTLTAGCHAWLLAQLDALQHVAVLCDTGFVCAREVKDWMRSVRNDGSPVIVDGGNSTAPNLEVLLTAQTDAVWLSPMQGMTSNLVHTNLPIIYCADYLETSPLGRAEWMKFYGRLVGQETKADALYAQVKTQYEANIAPTSKGQKLLAELPYGATWYVPGGCSTAAQLYADAGYDYPWANDKHPGSLALSREAVVAQGSDCDVWLIKYMADEDWSLTDLFNQHPAYRHIRATLVGGVWGCNTATSDYFDVTPFRPDSLLHSLVQMDGAFFHKLKQ